MKRPNTTPGGRAVPRRASRAATLLLALAVLAGLGATPARAQTQIFSVAGSGVIGSTGDGGAATLADVNYPRGLTALPDGGFLVTEAFGHRVRRVMADGRIVPFAGSGTMGFAGDGGPATAARFNLPHGTVRLPDGRVLIADTNNFRIREVALDGRISTVAGTGTRGFGGDGGPAAAATISAPRGIGGTADGGYLIADSDNNRVRKVAPDGTITTVAGNGTRGFGGDGGPATAAALNAPYGVSALADGSFYIADSANHRIRRVAPDGTISTVAGTGAAAFSGDGGPAVSASLRTPHAVEATADGRLLIADMGNHRVREVGSDGVIRTVAGTGTPGFSGEAEEPGTAKLFYPKAVLSFGSGLLVADSDNYRVRYIGSSPWPTPAPGSGIVFLNGAEPFTNSAQVSVSVPAEGATQVRLSNSPAVTNGVLSSGTTFAYSTPLAWDLTNPATGGSAAQGTRLVYVQWFNGATWSPVSADSIVLNTGAPPPDTTAPETTITSGPAGTSTAASASFAFTSEPGASFGCNLSGPGMPAGSWAGCSSPQSYSGLAPGSYTFSVRATDSAGNTDASPATRSFTVAAPAGTTPTQPDPGSGEQSGGGPVPGGGPAEIVRSGSGSRAAVAVTGAFALPGVAVRCAGEGPDCAGTITVIGSVPGASGRRRSVTLGRSSFAVGTGGTLRIKSRLTRKGLRLLARAKRLRARVVIDVARGPASAKKTVTITLVAPRRR